MIPVCIIGGYLGAGKTTLINHMLRHADGRRLAVLVNEFGALPIDADLIEAEGEDLISIAGGCICCSFGDNLVGALMDLSQLTPAPDHILIEASGVAIPASIAASISLLPAYARNAIIVLADAETVRDHAADRFLGDTVLRQLSDADLVVATKSDLIAPDAIQDVESWLQGKSPRARVIRTSHGAVAVDLLLGLEQRAVARSDSPHGDIHFDRHVIEVTGPVDAYALAKHLATGEFGIVRAKGFVRGLNGDSALLQIVGQRFEVTQDSGQEFAVVCIGLKGGLRISAIQSLVASMADSAVV